MSRETSQTSIEITTVAELGYARCHAAFERGFSDYAVKLDVGLETFTARFFGVEGNAPARSFVALAGDEPIGVILGGVRRFAGALTMRMGAMAIAPEHRGRHGLSDALFDRHLAAARAAGCAQLWLEVLTDNARALAFYRRRGYAEFGRLRYYLREHARERTRERFAGRHDQLRFAAIPGIRARALAPPDQHLNWQNEHFCVARVDDQRHFGLLDGDRPLAALSVDPRGRLAFLYVHTAWRRRGLATRLLEATVDALSLPRVSLGMPESAALDGFLRARGFTRRPLEQHEMRRLA